MTTVYVIRSLSHDYRYVGITKNLKDRLKRHNNARSYSTKPYAPFKLILTEEFADYSEARKREKFLKSGAGRKFLDSIEF